MSCHVFYEFGHYKTTSSSSHVISRHHVNPSRQKWGASSSFYCNHIDAVECIYVIECDCWCDTVEAWHLCEWWSLPFRTFYIKAHPPTYTTWLEVATLNSIVLGTYVLRVFVETSSVYFCTYRQAMWVYSVYIHHSGEQVHTCPSPSSWLHALLCWTATMWTSVDVIDAVECR